jgi:hypothetical protein
MHYAIGTAGAMVRSRSEPRQMPANRIDAVVSLALAFGIAFIVGRAFFSSLPLPV